MQSSTIESSVVHVVDYRPLPPLNVLCSWPAGLHRWCRHATSKRKMRVTSPPLKLHLRNNHWCKQSTRALVTNHQQTVPPIFHNDEVSGCEWINNHYTSMECNWNPIRNLAPGCTVPVFTKQWMNLRKWKSSQSKLASWDWQAIEFYLPLSKHHSLDFTKCSTCIMWLPSMTAAAVLFFAK